MYIFKYIDLNLFINTRNYFYIIIFSFYIFICVYRVAAMECTTHAAFPKCLRRRKSAKERRAQRIRSAARAFQCVAQALNNVEAHRGGKLKRIGRQWHSYISAPPASEVPMPRFHVLDIQHTVSNTVHQGDRHASGFYSIRGRADRTFCVA